MCSAIVSISSLATMPCTARGGRELKSTGKVPTPPKTICGSPASTDVAMPLPAIANTSPYSAQWASGARRSSKALPAVAGAGWAVLIRTTRRTSVSSRIRPPAIMWPCKAPILSGELLGTVFSAKVPMTSATMSSSASSQCKKTSTPW